MQTVSTEDNLHEVSKVETIFIKCQNPFSGKIKKKKINMSSAENFNQSAKRSGFQTFIKLI